MGRDPQIERRFRSLWNDRFYVSPLFRFSTWNQERPIRLDRTVDRSLRVHCRIYQDDSTRPSLSILTNNPTM